MRAYDNDKTRVCRNRYNTQNSDTADWVYKDMAAVVWEKLSQRIALIEVADTLTIDMYSREMRLYADVKKLNKKQRIIVE